jgi:hypothetical protein
MKRKNKNQPSGQQTRKPVFSALGSPAPQLQDFLVGGEEVQISESKYILLVRAKDEEEALLKYAENYRIHHEFFRDHVYTPYVPSLLEGFARRFWPVNPKTRMDKLYDEMMDNMAEAEGEEIEEEEEPPLVDEETFRERVRGFFTGRPDFAELYLNYYFDPEMPTKFSFKGDDYPDVFPKEMLLWIFFEDDTLEPTVVVPLSQLTKIT